MLILRIISAGIKEKILGSNKIVLLYGARQLGKTTLSKALIGEIGLKTLLVNADQSKYVDVLSSKDLSKLKALVSGYELLFIDEAQRIPDLGINLKILIDELPHLKILVTGSSSFRIASDVSESLTGRKWTFELFPLSLEETGAAKNTFEIQEDIENLLIHGSYPEIYTTERKQAKEDQLLEITDSYLFKDILELANIKHPRKIKDLLRLLAFQIGSEVSVLELSRNLGINRETVENYLDLLEKAFVVFRLSGFSRNLRKEISKHDKFYFFDLGIRNAIIGNFNYLNQRNDVGILWENFIIAERRKYLSYHRIHATTYFWRTYTGAELDYVESLNNELHGYEIKYSKTIQKPPKTWMETYSESKFTLINRDNFVPFLCPGK